MGARSRVLWQEEKERKCPHFPFPLPLDFMSFFNSLGGLFDLHVFVFSLVYRGHSRNLHDFVREICK